MEKGELTYEEKLDFIRYAQNELKFWNIRCEVAPALCMLLRNYTEDQIDGKTYSFKESLEKFPELHEYKPTYIIDYEDRWWDPKNFNIRMKVLEKIKKELEHKNKIKAKM